MRNLIKCFVAGISAFLLFSDGAKAGNPVSHHDATTTVAPLGPTDIRASFGTDTVSAVIVTLVHPKYSDHQYDVSACTHSRNPCSLVARLGLRVGKNEVLVPPSVTLRLADVNRANLRRISAGKFELVLECGDASEAYDAHVIFNVKRVTEVNIFASEAGMLAEKVIYSDLSHAFDD